MLIERTSRSSLLQQVGCGTEKPYQASNFCADAIQASHQAREIGSRCGGGQIIFDGQIDFLSYVDVNFLLMSNLFGVMTVFFN